MLILISDLHFMDGTAGTHFVSPEVFKDFFESLYHICKKLRNRIKEIKIVFLGDIFDLLRSEHWFDFPVDERPWGNNYQAVEEHALTIFSSITNHPINLRSFGIIQQGLEELASKFTFFDKANVIYIPGNHDRLCNIYLNLRKRVCDCLGIGLNAYNSAQYYFPHSYGNVDYGVFARHGHEFDWFNYEGRNSFEEEDYSKVPIGDPITTELLTKLPYILDQRLKNMSSINTTERRLIKRIFQEVENVRPISNVIGWLSFQAEQMPLLKNVLEDVLHEVIDDFNKLEFVRSWYSRHREANLFNEAKQIQIVFHLLKKFKLSTVAKILHFLSGTMNLFIRDSLLTGVWHEYHQLDPRIRYVVYGHIHDPSIVPLSRERIYLNAGTGTLREGHWKSSFDESSISWRSMTYLIFYRKDEMDAPIPVCEARTLNVIGYWIEF